MKSEIFSFTDSDLTETLNEAKEHLFKQLQHDDIIANAEELSTEYLFVVCRKNMFGKFFDKLFNKTEDTYTVEIIRTNNKAQV